MAKIWFPAPDTKLNYLVHLVLHNMLWRYAPTNFEEEPSCTAECVPFFWKAVQRDTRSLSCYCHRSRRRRVSRGCLPTWAVAHKDPQQPTTFGVHVLFLLVKPVTGFCHKTHNWLRRGREAKRNSIVCFHLKQFEWKTWKVNWFSVICLWWEGRPR